MKGRSYLTALGCTATEAAARSLVLYDRDARRGLLKAEFLMEGFSPESIKTAFLPSGLSVIQTATRMDFHTYLPDDILVKVDRAAMMSSLEVRAPMLDRQVVELAFGRVPDDLKAGYRRRKFLLRKLAGRRLPPELDVRRKQGFSIPLHTWLNTGKATMLLDAAKALPPEMVNPQYVDALIAAQRGGANHAERIFCLAMLSFWLNHYKIRTG
jgi:asparagine synthase (glutamine-hydrolysing)